MSITENRFSPANRQRGAVLMLLLLLVSVGALAVFVSGLNRATVQLERDRVTAAALAQAKEALIGYAVANPSMPGGLPFPDRNGDGNYDGSGDCVTVAVTGLHLLGQLPVLLEQGCGPDVPALGVNLVDSAGGNLWYAVSANLVKSNGGTYPVITSSSVMNATSGWLIIRDQLGTAIASDVAFLVMAAGDVLPGQDRGGVPAALAYLDAYVAGAATYQNWNGDGDYIQAQPINDASNHFNDSLLYVSKTEFATRLAERAAGEIRSRLSSPYPDALPSGLPAWFAANWTGVTVYQKNSNTSATVTFSNCAASFAFGWTGAGSIMKRTGTC